MSKVMPIVDKCAVGDHGMCRTALPSPPHEPEMKRLELPVYPQGDLAELIADLRAVLGPSSGLDAAEVDVEALMERVRQYNERNEHEWAPYALADPTRGYTRNGVDDINKKANLLILVWNPGRGSMIHDHANAHCVVKVLKGHVTETRYDFPEGYNGEDADAEFEPHTMSPKSVTTFNPGDVSYMSDELGLHRMSNPSSSEVAVTMHLYTPPYAAKFGCHIYDEKSGKSHKVDVSTLFSDKGVKCDPWLRHGTA